VGSSVGESSERESHFTVPLFEELLEANQPA